MPRNLNADALMAKYGLQPSAYYLLPLIPLIEMMWADGMAQPAEISLLYEKLTRHLAELHAVAGGQEVVSIEEAEQFLARFLDNKPDPLELAELRGFALALIDAGSDRAASASRKQELLDTCLDIAAAAVNTYPYGKRERIMASEKALLHELVDWLNTGH